MDPDISKLPKRPGVYIFKGGKEDVIYVGKAKNLKNRLASYFQKSSGLDARKQKMVKLIRGFSYIVTGNELEALILEANLIKQHKPRFNIILRDDKNYPCLRLTVKEQWPKLEVVRKVKNDGNIYFGPYVPAQAMWEALAVIRKHFRIRTCKYPLDRPMRPCIQYQMKRCPAPCAGFVGREEYMKTVEDVRLFLLGEKTALMDRLQKQMLKLSDEMRFEEAAIERDRLTMLQRAFESQKVIAPELGDIDVIGYYFGDAGADDISTMPPVAFHVLFIRNGIMIGAKDFMIENPLADNEESILYGFIEAFYSKDMTPPPLILANKTPHGIKTLQEWLGSKRDAKVRISTPARGKKRGLLIMANENAKLHMGSPKHTEKQNIMTEVASKLNLAAPPKTIGAFDISTIQGSDSVGAYVFWEDGDFDKNRYRHVRIKNVEGMDDYAMMREAVERVLNSSVRDNAETGIPALVLIDGGAGQLAAARDIIEGSGINVELAGIAKKPDRAFLLSGEIIDIDDKSASSLLLRRIRDEVHRFAVSFHRRIRDKRALESPLEKIQGIGKKRRLALLRHFGSLDGIRNASVDEIAGIKGFNIKLAGKIKEAAFDEKTSGRT
ncbi:MAG: excinuclease ABC subunit UvrC [Nitrospirae bacterium]|nr:MAG: excinuclease ABC subunit UvrC [Nitrospirota bacterium]